VQAYIRGLGKGFEKPTVNPPEISELEHPVPPRNPADEMIVNLDSVPCIQNKCLSRLDGWPMRAPTDASDLPSRTDPHGSGSMRFATPSS
jgi:hypothetical protein